MVEILGYIATAFVVCSFLLKDVIKLRIVNAIGCLVFIVYGALTGAMPVVLLNGFLVCINGYYIWQSRKQ